MNTWPSRALITAPIRLWHRFQIWRAMRMYAEVSALERAAWLIKMEADRLMTKHAVPPAGPLFEKLDKDPEGR